MQRYELVFVVNVPDEIAHEAEDVVRLPWWPYIGEDPMSPEWLEYVLVRELLEDENTFDFLDEDGINVIFEDRSEEMAYEKAKTIQHQQVAKELPEWLRLVVDNDDKKGKDEADTPKE